MAHSDGRGEVSCRWSAGRDIYGSFVVLNESFAYASIEKIHFARRFAHVNGSGYRFFCAWLLNESFPLILEFSFLIFNLKIKHLSVIAAN